MEDKCFECGVCCKLFLIDLSETEYKSKKYKTQFQKFGIIKDFNQAKECGANIIEQDGEGGCIYLCKGKCSIHKMRPEACREFFCMSKDKKFKEMIININIEKNKK